MDTTKDKNNLSPSRQLAAKVIFEAFNVLKEVGGQLSGKEVMEKIEQNLQFNDWEKGRYEKTGNIRWQSILHFFTIDCIKAGFLIKQKGIWILTKEGEEAIKLGAVTLLQTVSEAYKKWKNETKSEEVVEGEPELRDKKQLRKANLDLLEEQALNGLSNFIASKNPYEFQDLVAALLHAMGYYISFVSPRGKDSGIDIVAYQDPLGTKTPRIKVQVKHRPEATIAVNEIRSLAGLLNRDGDVGLFVTSGNFTSEAENLARNTHIHVELIDFERFISLWQDYYHKLSDEEKNMLPLKPIYFLGSNE